MKFLLLFIFITAALFATASAFARFGYMPWSYRGRVVNEVKNSNVEVEHLNQGERNALLLEHILNSTSNSNSMTDIVKPWVNFYDDSFDKFLEDQMTFADSKERKELYGKIRCEINSLRRQQLLDAQELFLAIVKLKDIKQMESKLLEHLERNEIQLPFMMILEMNLENALATPGEEEIATVLLRLQNVIFEFQDRQVPIPVRLLRQLLRMNDGQERRDLLRKRLILSLNTTSTTKIDNIFSIATNSQEVLPDTNLKEFEAAIEELTTQLTHSLERAENGDLEKESIEDLIFKCAEVRQELREILEQFR